MPLHKLAARFCVVAGLAVSALTHGAQAQAQSLAGDEKAYAAVKENIIALTTACPSVTTACLQSFFTPRALSNAPAEVQAYLGCLSGKKAEKMAVVYAVLLGHDVSDNQIGQALARIKADKNATIQECDKPAHARP